MTVSGRFFLEQQQQKRKKDSIFVSVEAATCGRSEGQLYVDELCDFRICRRISVLIKSSCGWESNAIETLKP